MQEAGGGLPTNEHQVKRAFFDRSGDMWLNDGQHIYIRRNGQAAFSDSGNSVRQARALRRLLMEAYGSLTGGRVCVRFPVHGTLDG